MPNRDLNELEPNFKLKVETWLKECPEIFITETYRTVERQQELYRQGYSYCDGIETLSNHQRRIAVDIAFLGEELYPGGSEQWERIADKALEYGIDWGLNLWGWDLPHFQDNGKPLLIEDVDKKKENKQNRSNLFIDDEKLHIGKSTRNPNEKLHILKPKNMEISGYIYATKDVENQINFLIQKADEYNAPYSFANPNPEVRFQDINILMNNLWPKLSPEDESLVEDAYDEIAEHFNKQIKLFIKEGVYQIYSTKDKSND